MPLTITCPSCGSSLDLDDAYRDWKVRCPDCRHEFVPVVPPPTREASLAPLRHARRESTVEDCTSVAVGLTVVAILQLCVCAFIVFFNAVVRPNLPAPMNPVPDDEEAEMVFWIVVGVLGLGQGTLMILGAVALKGRRRYGLALSAALGALVPVNVCCFTAVPFAIWALVILARPDVRAAFAANREQQDHEPETG